MSNIKPYILIGGKSSRFGTDKATFEYEGEMLGARAVRITETAFTDQLATFVSRTCGSFLGRRMIADLYPDRGAAGAIHAALSDARDGWMFILACDLPLVTPDFIEQLSEHTKNDHGCIIPVQFDGRWQPLCALYNVQKCLKTFEHAITDDGKHSSLRAIVAGLDPRIVDFSEFVAMSGADRMLMNVNSMADLESI